MRVSNNDASRVTRREALGVLATAAGAGLLGAAAGLMATAAGRVPGQDERTLNADVDPSALAATLRFF